MLTSSCCGFAFFCLSYVLSYCEYGWFFQARKNTTKKNPHKQKGTSTHSHKHKSPIAHTYMFLKTIGIILVCYLVFALFPSTYTNEGRHADAIHIQMQMHKQLHTFVRGNAQVYANSGANGNMYESNSVCELEGRYKFKCKRKCGSKLAYFVHMLHATELHNMKSPVARHRTCSHIQLPTCHILCAIRYNRHVHLGLIEC